jgi:hypothetical protein
MRPFGWGIMPDWREVTTSRGPTWQLHHHLRVGLRDCVNPPSRHLEQTKCVRNSRASLSAEPPSDAADIDTELARRGPPPVLPVERPSDSDELPRCGAQVVDVPGGSYRRDVAHPLPGRAELPCRDTTGGRAQVPVPATDGASARGIRLVGTEDGLVENWGWHQLATACRRVRCATSAVVGSPIIGLTSTSTTGVVLALSQPVVPSPNHNTAGARRNRNPIQGHLQLL